MQSPAKLEHTDTACNLLVLLRTYVQIRQLGFVGFAKMLITLSRNDYEPDICLFGDEKAAQFTPKHMQFPYSTRVAIHHVVPPASCTPPRLSSSSFCIGSCTDIAPTANARWYVASTSAT